LVILRPCEAKGLSRSYSAPTLSLIDNINDVLSFPVRCGGFCDRTKNRVKLFRLSSIRDLMTFNQ
jgi:hypothetical protein